MQRNVASNVKYKGGVLIIGSLLWQDYLSEKGDNLRKKWRDENLLLTKKTAVSMPIRYGRKSKNGMYTMVFSSSCRNKKGKAFFVPFKNGSSENLKDLDQQIISLSKAEGMNGNMVAGNNVVWGVVSILLNRQRLDPSSMKIILEWWKDKFKNEKIFNINSFKIGKELPSLKEDAILNFSWPKAFHKKDQSFLNDFDFIVATSTVPSKYPTINELVDSVANDKERGYFINNYQNDIITFQDNRILKKVEKLKKLSEK